MIKTENKRREKEKDNRMCECERKLNKTMTMALSPNCVYKTHVYKTIKIKINIHHRKV